MTTAALRFPCRTRRDREYSERAIPQYEHAVTLAGGEPVRIPLDSRRMTSRRSLQRCDGVLLPGSNADVDPARFRRARSLHTAAADPRRRRSRRPIARRRICASKAGARNLLRPAEPERPSQRIARFSTSLIFCRRRHAPRSTTRLERKWQSRIRLRLIETRNWHIACGDSSPPVSGRAQLGGRTQMLNQGRAGDRAREFFSPPICGFNRRRPAHRGPLPGRRHHRSAGRDCLRITLFSPCSGIQSARLKQDEPSRAIFRGLMDAVALAAIGPLELSLSWEDSLREHSVSAGSPAKSDCRGVRRPR